MLILLALIKYEKSGHLFLSSGVGTVIIKTSQETKSLTSEEIYIYRTQSIIINLVGRVDTLISSLSILIYIEA